MYFDFQMKRQKCFVAAAFAFIVIASIVAALNANCMLKCICGQTHVDCTGVIPEAVAVSVRPITLKEIHYSEFHPRRFCNVTYTNVTDLTIYPVYFNRHALLGDHVFDCLSQLTKFKFRSPSSWWFS